MTRSRSWFPGGLLMKRHVAGLLALVILAGVGRAADANVWVKPEKGTITGQRWDVPLGYDPGAKRFLVLGGRTSFGEYKKARPYDELALDLGEGRWENWFPKGKDWGPAFGPSKAPAWADEHWSFRDAEGNTRPNWTVYGTFSLGQKYDYDPEGK